MITVILFHYCEKVFILMNMWMIGKNPMKHHYVKKKLFTVLNVEDITDPDYAHAKSICKDLLKEICSGSHI